MHSFKKCLATLLLIPGHWQQLTLNASITPIRGTRSAFRAVRTRLSPSTASASAFDQVLHLATEHGCDSCTRISCYKLAPPMATQLHKHCLHLPFLAKARSGPGKADFSPRRSIPPIPLISRPTHPRSTTPTPTRRDPGSHPLVASLFWGVQGPQQC